MAITRTRKSPRRRGLKLPPDQGIYQGLADMMPAGSVLLLGPFDGAYAFHRGFRDFNFRRVTH